VTTTKGKGGANRLAWLEHKLTMLVTLVCFCGQVGGGIWYAATVKAEVTSTREELIYLRTRYNEEVLPKEQVMERLERLDRNTDHLTDILIEQRDQRRQK
jgi:hypothetical protein